MNLLIKCKDKIIFSLNVLVILFFIYIFQSVVLPSLIIGIIINIENVALHALFIYDLELGIR